MTDKKFSTILIYKNQDTNIYTEKVGIDYSLKLLIKCKKSFEDALGELNWQFVFNFRVCF